VLPLFLAALRDRYQPGEVLHVKLAALVESTRSHLDPSDIASSEEAPSLDGNMVGDVISANYAYAIARIEDYCGYKPLQVDVGCVLQAGIRAVIPEGFKAEPFLLPTDKEVIEFDITVFGEDMDIEPSWTQSFVFHQDEDDDLLEFRLIPKETGTKEIKVEYYYRRHWLVQIKFEVKVIQAPKAIPS
jgi:hypothetical protein